MNHDRQGAHNMGTGFEPGTPKRGKRKLGRVPSKRSTNKDESDDALDVIGANDSATHITSLQVFGKEVPPHPEFKKTNYKGMKISKNKAVSKEPSVEVVDKPQRPTAQLKSSTPSSSSFSSNPTPIPIPERPRARLATRQKDVPKEQPMNEKQSVRTRPPQSKSRSLVSPSSSPPKRRKQKEREIAPFPLDLNFSAKPPSKRTVSSKGSIRKKVESEDDDNEKEEGTIAAFPMTDNELMTIGSSRGGSPVSDDEFSRTKRRKNDIEDEDVSFIFHTPLASKLDPSRLCPYCDAILPKNPSPQLIQLLAQTALKSYPHFRPTNRKGLKAPITVYIAVCQRHEFENDVLPKAEANGWPREINWAAVRERIQAMKSYLEELITEPTGKSRRNCVFWHEVLDDIKTKGTRTAKGVKGQFDSFEKIQPGYYGEMGSVIIHQTLFDMFPLSTFDVDHITPLTPEEFIRSVLVPEAATQLIMQDQSLKQGSRGASKAVKILRESSGYGVAMFPDDSGFRTSKDSKMQKELHDAFVDVEDDEMGVGDMILMERARQRRKEIAKEAEMSQDDGEGSLRRKEKPRPKTRRKVKASDSVMSLSDSKMSSLSSSPIGGSDSDVLARSRKHKPLLDGVSLPRTSKSRTISAKSLGDLEISSEEEILTSNEDGPPVSSSVTRGSSPPSIASSDVEVLEADDTVHALNLDKTPKPIKLNGSKVRAGRLRSNSDKWSTSLANSSSSSSDRSSRSPARVDKSDSGWLLDPY